MPGYYNTATDATLSGHIEMTPRMYVAGPGNLPVFSYIKVVLESGNPEDGYVAAVVPGDQGPQSTASVAREVREVIALFPGYEFNGTLIRTAGAEYGSARSRISVANSVVRF